MLFERFDPQAWAKAVRATGWRASYQVHESISGMLSIKLMMIGFTTVIIETDGYVTTLRGISHNGDDMPVTPAMLIGMVGEEAVPCFLKQEETVILLKGACHD